MKSLLLILLFPVLSFAQGRNGDFGQMNFAWTPISSVNLSTPIIDQLGISSAAAYSLRKLRSAYSGACINVRRSSDNTSQNIGFDGNGNLDTTALKTFVGSNNGFVTIWYDQIANGRNASQATAASQPQIVTGGVVNRTPNGIPSLYFAGANFVGLPSALALQSLNAVAVYDIAAQFQTNNYPSIFGSGPTPSTMPAFYGVANSKAFGSNLPVKASPNYNIYTNGNNTGTVSNIQAPNIVTIIANSVTTSISGYRIGNGDYAWRGYIPELIVFGSALTTTDRQNLERNQGAYYSITVN